MVTADEERKLSSNLVEKKIAYEVEKECLEEHMVILNTYIFDHDLYSITI
jgi:hypothetical protein